MELLRQLLDQHVLFEPITFSPRRVSGVSIVAACQTAGGGSYALSPRLLRHFNIICMPQSASSTLFTLFGRVFGAYQLII